MAEIVYKCSDCGSDILITLDDSAVEIFKLGTRAAAGFLCANCVKRIEDDRAAMEENMRLETIARKQEQLEEIWRELCPREFLYPDPAKLPDMASKSAFYKATMWDGRDGLGMLFYGGTGKGKTLTMWAVLKKVFMQGKSFYIATATDFATQCAAHATVSSARLEKFLNKLRNCALVCIDDLGKKKMTEAAEGHFHDIIDHRCIRGLPFVITCEGDGAWLASRFDESRRASIVRRIVQHTETISFGPPLPEFNWPVNSK